MTNEYFIKRAKEIHGNKYDYSKVIGDFKNNKEKIIIICPIHGEFLISINNFLNGRGCKYCSKEEKINKKRLTTEEFIKRAKEVHGDKYDYSKVEYIKANIKVCIICPIHGEFWQSPYSHTKQKEGCPLCANINRNKKRKLTTEEFIKRAKEVHGDKYDYSKVEYIDNHTKVCIIHKDSGVEFWQIPYSHIKYNGFDIKNNAETFKKRMIEKFGNIYDFSKMNFIDMKTKVTLVYNNHDVISTPTKFICANKPIFQEKMTDLYSFIRKAKEIHGERYDYSKVNYIDSNTKVCIICKEHGEFWQKPKIHLSGSGCNNCKITKLEMEIKKMLDDNNMKYIYQYYPKFLSDGLSHQSLDFYLPEYNIAIECQGLQHFNYVKYFKTNIEDNIKRDTIKYNKCINENINIIYYVDYHISLKNIISDKYNNIYKINNSFKNKDKLLEKLCGITEKNIIM